jgi:hypothetical protein
MAVLWRFIEASGFPHEPVTGEHLRSLCSQGSVLPSTPVRRESGEAASHWVRAGEVKGLFTGDVSSQLGRPICAQCGRPQQSGRCPNCDPPVLPQADTHPNEALVASDFSPEPNERYPHLQKYLGILERASLIALRVLVILTLIGLAIAGGSGPTGFVLALIVMPMFWVLAYVSYLASMAFVQIVRVLLDIEENTRNTELHIRQIQ